MVVGKSVSGGSGVLVVYYSRSGLTRRIAGEIVESLGCDVEEVVDMKSRSGVLGWFGAGRDGGAGNLTQIGPVERDASGYGLVVLGTPIWNGDVSAPIRTYIVENRERLPDVAFFSTQDGDENRAFETMEKLCGRAPVAAVQLRKAKEIEAGKYMVKLDRFVSLISGWVQ